MSEDLQILSLTTDFGLADGFVAACHGVAARIAPSVRIIDVTHQVPFGDIRRGAALLAQAVPYLPRGVHVAVVDPGVGTTRKPVAVGTADGMLVGPDNGVLMWAADALGGATTAVALTNPELHLHPVSHTFHGRDIFTPVAAALATGTVLADAGDPVAVAELTRLPEPVVRCDDDSLSAEVLTIDRFGNLQLAAPAEALNGFGERMTVGGQPAVRGDMFAAAEPGTLVVLVDATRHVAVAVNRDSAAERLGVRPGDILRIDGD